VGVLLPTRYLKPGIRDSERINALSADSEVLFYRLLVTVDDFGRFDARPAMVKAACFPIKDDQTSETCERGLAELALAGLIAVYKVDGKPFLQMQKWDNSPRARESKFPKLTDECAQLYTEACKPRAVAVMPRTLLPVTVTVTGTDNREPETENRKPENKSASRSAPAAPSEVDEQVWADFLATRKQLKAAVTETALDAIRREATLAGMSLEDALRMCCARGWRGFKAEWVQTKGQPPGKQSALEERNRQAAQEWLRMKEAQDAAASI
jgi:hypothetical protein